MSKLDHIRILSVLACALLRMALVTHVLLLALFQQLFSSAESQHRAFHPGVLLYYVAAFAAALFCLVVYTGARLYVTVRAAEASRMQAQALQSMHLSGVEMDVLRALQSS